MNACALTKEADRNPLFPSSLFDLSNDLLLLHKQQSIERFRYINRKNAKLGFESSLLGDGDGRA